MATIKSYIDIEQSEKLAEILPIETADMLWEQHGAEPYVTIKPWTTIGKSIGCHCLSCWSLAALLGVLPNNENISTNLSKGGYRISTFEYTNSWFVEYEDKTNGLNNCVTSADNPVDACVAMIEKLHELKML